MAQRTWRLSLVPMRLLLSFLLLAAAPPEARLEEAKALYRGALYEESALVLTEVLASSVDGTVKQEALLYLAFGQVALGRDDVARAALAELLALDRNARLPPFTSPKLAQVFEEVRSSMPPPPRIDHVPPGELPRDGALVFELRGADAAVLLSRPQGTAVWEERPLVAGPDGFARVAIRELLGTGPAQLAVIEYSAAGPAGETLAGPFVLRVAAPMLLVVVEEDPPLFARWWFWAGAAVVVGGIGAIVLGTSDDPAPQEPSAGGGTARVRFELRQ